MKKSDSHIGLAREILKRENVDIVEVFRNYVYFKIIGDGVNLVVYPHKVRGTGNIHPRVRNENSKNRMEAARIAFMLSSFENSSLFTVKNNHALRLEDFRRYF